LVLRYFLILVYTLVTTFANNVEQGAGSVQTVLANASIVFPAGLMGDWIEIPLDTSFYYNGVDNLVVDITTNVACSGDFHTDTSDFGYTSTVFNSDINATAGTGAPFRADMEFNFEGGDNPIFSNPTISATVPFNVDPAFQRQQQLYLASDINGSGSITGLGIQVGNLTLEETYTVSVNLGHANVSTLSLDYAANYSGSPVTVANAVSFTIPANVPADSYVWIPLPDAVFTYNGTDNLILEFDVTAATGDTWFSFHDHGSGDDRLIYGPSDASVIMPVDVAIHHIKLRFNGGMVDVITAEDETWIRPFFTFNDDKTQLLFDAWQLGTGGPVTGISFRLASDSVAADYPAASVVFGHTTNTVLSNTFADNMTDPTTVFNGTINFPAGLKAGDWVTIPVSGFTYDPTQNLVIEVTKDAGTAGNDILATGVDVPGASGGVVGARTGPSATVLTPGQSDIQIHLSK